jgi:signal transduction histidine kinase/ligand-binding sensor domain-containing protein
MAKAGLEARLRRQRGETPPPRQRRDIGRNERADVLSSRAMPGRLPFALLPGFCAWALAVSAQDLPSSTYTTTDGLPHDIVIRLVQDRRGFLWAGGPAGVARFDGERFAVYGQADGLDVATGTNALRTGAPDELWIATNGAGIFRFDLASRDSATRFTQVRVGDSRATNRVNTLAVQPDGLIWAGTDAGLLIGRPGQAFHRIALPLPEGQSQDGVQISSVFLHQSGVWVGTLDGTYVCRSAPEAACVRGPRIRARMIVPDREGRLWMATPDGIHIVRPGAGGSVSDPPDVLAIGTSVTRLFIGSDGVLASTEDGRVLLVAGHALRELFRCDESVRIYDVIEDATRNLWIGTTRGLVAVRLFSARDGLRTPYLLALRRDAGGQVYVQTENYWLHRIEAEQLTSVRLRLPAGVRPSIWSGTAILVDRTGDVWLGTARGLFRYTRPAYARDRVVEVTPASTYTTADGLAGNHVSEIFEDSAGDLWIATMPAGPDTLTVWRRQHRHFERLGRAAGLPPFNQPTAFMEDRSGSIWARLREGGIIRVRDNRADVFGEAHGVPTQVTASLIDRQGRLWLGGQGSLARVADVAADVIRVTTTVHDVGRSPRHMLQDRTGRLFVGTFDGLQAVDSEGHGVRRISSFEGLPRGSVDALVEDRDGSLLLIVGRTLARLTPSSVVAARSPPRCLLSSVQVAGRALSLPDAGLERVEVPDISPGQNHIEVEFLGLSPRLGEPLSYEYRLRGISDGWTRARDRRVTYAGLAAGRYTFEARAAGADGQSMSSVATLSFRVLPPWYQRWWFLSAALAASLLLVYLVHRARLGAAIRTERLRSRIATDLHDDIGASLSQISILAELARRRAGTVEARVAEPLASIATTSRDLVDAMSDIVWAVNPRTDSLADLTRRMHRFAEETLGGADIALEFSGPQGDADLRIGADVRRELYLILKESVNNIARHSGASRAWVAFALIRQELRLVITDDGRGFDPGARVDGNGLASMRKRAAAFGGTLDIDSGPGRGTQVRLTASLRHLAD